MSARTILLVEDNPDDEALTLKAMRRSGVAEHVMVVRDGAEAIDYLFGIGLYAGRDVTDLPALILLDLKLPKFDGIELLRRIRADERTCLACVVIFTSSDEERDRIEAYRHHANGFVRKPVAFEQFSRAVEQLCDYWLKLNEFAPSRITESVQ